MRENKHNHVLQSEKIPVKVKRVLFTLEKIMRADKTSLQQVNRKSAQSDFLTGHFEAISSVIDKMNDSIKKHFQSAQSESKKIKVITSKSKRLKKVFVPINGGIPFFNVYGSFIPGEEVESKDLYVLVRNINKFQEGNGRKEGEITGKINKNGRFSLSLIDLAKRHAVSTGDRIFIGVFSENTRKCYAAKEEVLKYSDVFEGSISIELKQSVRILS
ncbi:MAG: hypothetical protein HQM10_06495 [Candidatus Riflebacteria bacterium]|nr:hypothetical protein [Candidatus Riflebacteria bacterium]